MSNPAVVSNYAKRMGQLSAKIFGEIVRPTSQKSTKVVRIFQSLPLDLNDDIVKYYPDHVTIGRLMMNLRAHGLYRDEHEDFKDEMKRLRKLRGKGPPERKKKPTS